MRKVTLVVLLSIGVTGAFVTPVTRPSVRPRELFAATADFASASSAAAAFSAAAALEKQKVLDFAIVGGGPAGLAAAVGLKDQGFDVQVFEGKGTYIQTIRKNISFSAGSHMYIRRMKIRVSEGCGE